MSEPTKDAPYPAKRTDSVIRAGVRIDGRVDFAGVLRVEGEIAGDVTGSTDPRATIVVEESGCVAGTVDAPHVVIKGRILGALRSAGSIEVLPGGQAGGGAAYRRLAVHAGGIVDGALAPMNSPAPELPAAEVQARQTDAPAVDATVDAAVNEAVNASEIDAAGGQPAADAPLAPKPGRGHRIAWWVAAALAAPIVVWWNRPRPDAAPPADEAAAAPGSPAPAAPATGDRDAAPAARPPAPAAPPTPPPATPAPPANPAGVQAPPPADTDPVVTVQGSNAAKSAGVVYLLTREPVVLLRKKRGDRSEGTRVEVSEGRNVGVPIARGELLRVIEGRQLDIFYQGRKVSPSAIESGAWIGFVPTTAGE